MEFNSGFKGLMVKTQCNQPELGFNSTDKHCIPGGDQHSLWCPLDYKWTHTKEQRKVKFPLY